MPNLRELICDFIDTGSAEEYVIRDLQEGYPNIFTDEQISNEIKKLMEENLVIDRGVYLVWNYKK